MPGAENIWQDARRASLANFNFRTVTSSFNKLVYQYPIRIPERFSLVIRSLLTQEGICMTLNPDFKFLEVAYPSREAFAHGQRRLASRALDSGAVQAR